MSKRDNVFDRVLRASQRRPRLSERELRQREAEAKRILSADPAGKKLYSGKAAARPGTLGRGSSGIVGLVKTRLQQLDDRVRGTVRAAKADLLRDLSGFHASCKPASAAKKPKAKAKKKPKGKTKGSARRSDGSITYGTFLVPATAPQKKNAKRLSTAKRSRRTPAVAQGTLRF